jgi:serine/threonine-protein kinase SRPK3
LRKHYKDPALEANRDHTHNLQMFDQFFHHAINGKHFVMSFEVLGKNLLSLIKKHDYRGIPIPIVKIITK